MWLSFFTELFVWAEPCTYLSETLQAPLLFSSCILASGLPLAEKPLNFAVSGSDTFINGKPKKKKIIVEFLRLLLFSQKNPSLMDVLNKHTHHKKNPTKNQTTEMQYSAKGCMMTFLLGLQFLSPLYTHSEVEWTSLIPLFIGSP